MKCSASTLPGFLPKKMTIWTCSYKIWFIATNLSKNQYRNISEDLADIYQAIKDFIFVFQLGLNETMNDSLAICQEQFKEYWGQTLVNTLRALHDVKYRQSEEDEPEEDDCDDDDCHCHGHHHHD